MSETIDEVLARYTKRRAAFEAERAKLDGRFDALFRRWVAALFRERSGLNAVALATYQEYDSSQRVGHAYVGNHRLGDDAWRAASFPGECPENRVSQDEVEQLEETLMRFWPSLQRIHGDGWCIAAWRCDEEKDGVRVEKRDHPGFD
jgi:hypothetical protein